MSEDLIKRSDAIKAVWGEDTNPSEDGVVFEAQSHIDRDIRLIPSEDRPQKVIAKITFDEEKLREIVKEAVERFKEEYEIADRPQGEWIVVTNGRGGHECSRCHAYAPSYMSGDEHLSDYCPNCGKRMVEE